MISIHQTAAIMPKLSMYQTLSILQSGTCICFLPIFDLSVGQYEFEYVCDDISKYYVINNKGHRTEIDIHTFISCFSILSIINH